jgi:hypothetical protein
MLEGGGGVSSLALERLREQFGATEVAIVAGSGQVLSLAGQEGQGGRGEHPRHLDVRAEAGGAGSQRRDQHLARAPGVLSEHDRAARAGVACTGLGLPAAQPLLAAAAAGGVTLARQQVLRFSRPRQGGLATLRHLRQLGASASRQPPLPPGKLRRLLAHWPAGTPLTWEVLLLLGRKD